MFKTISLSVAVGLVLVSIPVVADDNAKETVTPTGTWRWETERRGNEFVCVMRLETSDDGTVAGTLTVNEDLVQLKDGEFKDGKLKIHTVMTFNGNDIEGTLVGTPKGNKMSGESTFNAGGQSRSFPWTPERKIVTGDVVGDWDVSFQLENGETASSKLIVKESDGKLTVVSQSVDGKDVDARDIKLKGDQLHFAATHDMEGSDLEIKVAGRVYGDKMSGTIAYETGENSGDIPFTAKRADADK